MTDKEWKHGSVTITLRDNGDFRATAPNGKLVTAPSLDAIKKKLDAINTATFTPFPVLEFSHSYYSTSSWNIEAPKEGKLHIGGSATGLEKERGGRTGNRYAFAVLHAKDAGYRAGHTTQDSTVHPDTPENREAITTYLKLMHENNLKRYEMQQAENTAEKRILVISATDYAAGIKEPKHKRSS